MRQDPLELNSGGLVDLSGMLVRIDYALQQSRARKVVLDGLEFLNDEGESRGRISHSAVSL